MRIGFRILPALAACGLLSACAHQAAQKPAPPPPAVAASAATERTITPASDLSGLVAPFQNVALTSDLTEPAVAVRVNEGDLVRRGEVLAVLSTADLRANLEAADRNAASAEAKLAQTTYQAQLAIAQGNNGVSAARAAVSQAQQNLALAETMLKSDQGLLKQGYIASQDVDAQRTVVENDRQALESAKAQLASAVANAQANGTAGSGLQAANVSAARAAVAQARAQADAIRVQIAKATIVSPIDGVVVNRNLNPGEYPGSRQIFTLQEIDHVYAALSAYAGQVVSLRRGAQVAITSNSLPGKTFTGRVVALLSPTTPSSTGFVVKVDVPNPQGTLRPGMAVLGHVAQPSVTGLTVPSTAFLDDNSDTVMVVRGGVAKVAHVSLRANDGRYAVVTGLPPGSRVVTDGSLGLADGEKVVLR
ncbi:MAG TPA: efflux RND transporter periplasmic adaptor subunit [Candidatus Dormibacteraeota bacterium]|nr:efflux RND transporter periplasmic adaptor subunit [Candidatus Dormibacteraeota bacterium]